MIIRSLIILEHGVRSLIIGLIRARLYTCLALFDWNSPAQFIT